MIFALLTLLTALALAATAGWFSIVGFMAIYAGAPIPALIMGAVTEAAKLVTVSWLYRNWGYATWKIKAPLIYFTIALMVATSIGVFGFLSKAHLEQGSGTIDNSSRIETLNYQINREKSLIADNEKVIGQLDATVNSFLGKDRTDRSLSVRKSQAPQRKQLRDDSDSAQKRIDTLSTDKFKLESEVRKMQLEVGPIRYIAELFYGVEENATKNIESAVRIFTLLIVSTLDPLAVILLIAANHTLLRLRNEKTQKNSQMGDRSSPEPTFTRSNADDNETSRPAAVRALQEPNQGDHDFAPPPTVTPAPLRVSILPVGLGTLNEEKNTDLLNNTSAETGDVSADIEDRLPAIPEVLYTRYSTETKEAPLGTPPVPAVITRDSPPPVVRQPKITRINFEDTVIVPPKPAAEVNSIQDVRVMDSTMREIIGHGPHFVPQKVIHKEVVPEKKTYPGVLSWLSEFKRT